MHMWRGSCATRQSKSPDRHLSLAPMLTASHSFTKGARTWHSATLETSVPQTFLSSQIGRSGRAGFPNSRSLRTATSCATASLQDTTGSYAGRSPHAPRAADGFASCSLRITNSGVSSTRTWICCRRVPTRWHQLTAGSGNALSCGPTCEQRVHDSKSFLVAPVVEARPSSFSASGSRVAQMKQF